MVKPAKKYLKEFFAVAEDAHCYQENDILAGLRYLNELARRREMPLVICMAIGTSFGGHNGDSLLAGVLDGYALLRNRCVVTGTGQRRDIIITEHLRSHRIHGQRRSG